MLFGWTMTILGVTMFAYGYWNAHRNLKIGLVWWTLLTALGIFLLIYGVNVLLKIQEAALGIRK